jgi:hypothetical protein
MTEKKKIVNTNKSTYEEYVKQGLWTPTGNVKFNVGNSGKVECGVKVKGRVSLLPALIIISDYFYDPKSVRR